MPSLIVGSCLIEKRGPESNTEEVVLSLVLGIRVVTVYLVVEWLLTIEIFPKFRIGIY